MAHHHLLPLILALTISLVILPSTSHAATQALFSDPLHFLFGGQSLTDGDLTLTLSNDCGLILYRASIPVIDFNTSTTTLNCALLLSEEGQLLLVPDNERTPTQTIGKETYSGRYALLFVDGKLGIFGPAIWNNGVTPSTVFININKHTLTGHEKLIKTGFTDYILFSGNISNGSANGDVVIAQNGEVSAVITKKCALAVRDDTRNTIWSSWPTSAESTECFLELTSQGELLLQGHNESGVFTQWKGSYAARENLYVCLLRYYGRITIYGLKTWLYGASSSSSSAAAAAAAAAATASVDVAENVKMVTA